MDFPLTDLMDDQTCYDFLVTLLHPNGLACPAVTVTTTWRSIDAIGRRFWSIAVSTASEFSMPSPTRSCTGRSDDPGNGS
jgi:hypothetical protein